MKKTLIEKIILGTVATATAVVLAILPISSYLNYQDYLADINEKQEQASNQNKKPVLESITATLKEGVAYYANDIAEAKGEHFDVVAHYTDPEGVAYDEVIEQGKFSVSTPADFYKNGGNITITYRTETATIPVTLLPVQLESIEVAVTPYSIKYAVGSVFSGEGMIINAVYNDGTVKALSSEDYEIDKTAALTAADNKVTVSYTEGEITKTADVEIGVTQTLNNGAVTSIVIVNGEVIVNAGDVLADAQMEVNAVYESGNRKLLTVEDYTVTGADEALAFGKKYSIQVKYNEDTSKIDSAEVTVRNTIQGEDGVIVGGKANSETEYKVIDGVITEQENKVAFAGGFSNSVTNGKEGSLTLTFESATETVGNITMRCGNSYTAAGDNGGYIMKPLQINTILDLTVNGREVQIPTTVILKGCGPSETYAPLYGIYYEFTFKDVTFDAGVNNVKFNFKSSTVGAKNYWGETPSTMNIDYVNFDTNGSEIPENYTITAIEIGNGINMEYGQDLADVEIPVIATLNNGTKIAIDSSECNIDISGSSNKDYVEFGEYTVTADLKSDNAIRTSTTVTVKAFTEIAVLTAGLEVVDDKVYYVFTGSSIGYTADQFEFFDAQIYDAEVIVDKTTFEMRINVTDVEVGTQINPHLRFIVDDENNVKMNYENGANSNGDIRDNGLTYTNGERVVLNGKAYTITTNWSMPSLTVSAYDSTSPICELTGVDLVVEGDKIYYTFTYNNRGYDKSTYEFFDGSNVLDVYEIYEEAKGDNITSLTFKIDVTDMAAGTFYPHLRIDGTNFDGNKGDILINGSSVTDYEAGKSVTLNGKTYTLKTSYNMPTLVVN